MRSRTIFLSFIVAATVVAISFSLVSARDSVPLKIEGAYEAVLNFPKASPTAILVFCPDGEPFSGVWVENGGEKFVGDMYDKSINGNELSFTIKAGPGVWEFVCTIDGKTMKGEVTGDGATSPFEGPRIELDKDFCTK